MSIGYKPALNAFHAQRFARSIGLPFNTLVTINFTDIGVSEGGVSSAFSRLRGSIARAWKYRRTKNELSVPLAYVVAHENPEGKRHIHWCLHVPANFSREFAKLVSKRVSSYHGPEAAACVDIRPVDFPAATMKYMLKGAEQEVARHFHIENRKDQGIVSGRRVTTSRVVGTSMRKEAGWNRKDRDWRPEKPVF